MASVHVFGSSGEAYNASQTDDGIRDGDVLSVPSERVVGILTGAWPVAVGETTGEFHGLAQGVWWDAVPGVDGGHRDYSVSFALAVETLDEILLDAAMRGGKS